MAFQEAKTVEALKLTDYLNKPLQAYYLGSKLVNTQFGEQTLHEFEKHDGSKLAVWGFTALNKLLENTPKGILTKVTYTGKSETKNKYGNKSHLCTVFFDAEKKLEGFEEHAEPNINPEEDSDDLPF